MSHLVEYSYLDITQTRHANLNWHPYLTPCNTFHLDSCQVPTSHQVPSLTHNMWESLSNQGADMYPPYCLVPYLTICNATYLVSTLPTCCGNEWARPDEWSITLGSQTLVCSPLHYLPKEITCTHLFTYSYLPIIGSQTRRSLDINSIHSL